MRHVHELIVAGRPVVRDGAVLGIDCPPMRDDMLARLRSDMHRSAGLATAFGELERAVTAITGRNRLVADRPIANGAGRAI